MKVSELDPKTNLGYVKIKIPDTFEQLTDEPLKEGYVAGMFASPGGWFMTGDSPLSSSRKLIPTYGKNEDILECEVIDIMEVNITNSQ